MDPVIAVFLGGVSPEREISLGSGEAAYDSLRRSFARVEMCDIRGARSSGDGSRGNPRGSSRRCMARLGGRRHAVVARGARHRVHRLDAAASELCFNKQQTKNEVRARRRAGRRGVLASRSDAGRAAALISISARCSSSKTELPGSSVGLSFVDDPRSLATALAAAEMTVVSSKQRIVGREVDGGRARWRSGWCGGNPARSGRFDFASSTPGD